jgi:hypothetical protein
MRLLKLFVLLATLAAAAAGAGHAAGAPWGPETPHFNLEVVLRPAAGGDGFGLVKFRQPNDENTIVYLGVWIRDLTPSHGYYLQRAVDTVVDGNCTGTGWLTLGKGPIPEVITTDERGTGRAALFRAVPPMLGMEFDIHFRVVDATTGAVVLQSGCYQYTVSK